MGLFDNEIQPGSDILRPCPNCGEDKMYRTSDGVLSSLEYYCDECGYESTKNEVQKSFREGLSEISLEVDQSEPSTDISLQELKLRPELQPDEELLFVESYKVNTFRDNAMIAITNQNIYTRPKKGTKTNNSANSLSIEDITRDLQIEDIEVVRTSHGASTGEIELETSDDIITISTFGNDTIDRAATAVVESAGLVSSEYDTEQEKQKQSTENNMRKAVAGTGGVLGVGGLVAGFFTLLLGVMFSVTIIGAIIGIPIIILGMMIIYGSAFSGVIGVEALDGINSGESEWIKP